MSQTNPALKGIMPALMTPFHDDFSVNFPMLKRLVAVNIENGCHGFFICGSTGEGLLLSPDERKQVAETVIQEVAGQVPVIVHVGSLSTRDAVALAKHAKQTGADAIATIPPIYYRVGIPGAVDYLRAIVNATDLPTYCYHIPAATGLPLSAEQMLELIRKVDGLAGMKYTHADLYMLWWILDCLGDSFSVFYGMDEQLLHGLEVGAVGGIGSTYNYQLKTIVKIYNAFQAGDMKTALEYQRKANRIVRIVHRHGWTTAVEKVIMKLKGLDVGPSRGPIPLFRPEGIESLRQDLETAGFFDD